MLAFRPPVHQRFGCIVALWPLAHVLTDIVLLGLNNIEHLWCARFMRLLCLWCTRSSRLRLLAGIHRRGVRLGVARARGADCVSVLFRFGEPIFSACVHALLAPSDFTSGNRACLTWGPESAHAHSGRPTRPGLFSNSQKNAAGTSPRAGYGKAAPPPCEQGHAERVGGSAYLVSDIEWMRYQ